MIKMSMDKNVASRRFRHLLPWLLQEIKTERSKNLSKYTKYEHQSSSILKEK
jgi:hypothetical protein